jgi:hypothetical protein
MILRNGIRQAHRWLGIALTVSILANFGTMAFGQPPKAIVYAPLIPLALVVLSGLYLFFLPYFAKARRASLSSSSQP